MIRFGFFYRQLFKMRSVIRVIKCSNLNDEKVGVKGVIDDIRFEGNDFDIDSQHQWIFSDQNIMNSKTLNMC
jgi:hypothetical protein